MPVKQNTNYKMPILSQKSLRELKVGLENNLLGLCLFFLLNITSTKKWGWGRVCGFGCC